MGFFDRLFKKNKEKENTKVAEIAIEEICEENNEPKVEDLPLENKKEEEVENKSVEIVQAIEENKEEPKEVKKGFFSSLKEKLFKSREGLFGTLKSFILGRNVIDDEMYEELEDILVQSDIGMNMTVKIVEALEKEVKKRGIRDPKEVYPVLKEVMAGFLITEGNDIKIEDGKLNVILVVGVNGVGKTTTIGKLAARYKKEGKKVILGAADTFRAAAIEQLEEWAKRSGTDIVKGVQGADPGAVVYDTLEAAHTRGADIAIIDTAGRLHNKNNLEQDILFRERIKKYIEDAEKDIDIQIKLPLLENNKKDIIKSGEELLEYGISTLYVVAPTSTIDTMYTRHLVNSILEELDMGDTRFYYIDPPDKINTLVDTLYTKIILMQI